MIYMYVLIPQFNFDNASSYHKMPANRISSTDNIRECMAQKRERETEKGRLREKKTNSIQNPLKLSKMRKQRLLRTNDTSIAQLMPIRMITK